ncbi:MAG: LL-diaminopimelate aminotransferase [bacterium]|nr:LL-diaminopimelate aminotransferase [bacterium]
MERAERIKKVPPYLFAEIDKKVAQAKAAGKDVISLGIGDPDLPTPGYIIDELIKEAKNPVNHQYPSYEGLPAFRSAVAEWCRNRFGIALDSSSEVLTLIGSKEGIAHLPLAFVNPGDIVLIPDPGYPVYKVATLFAGGEPYPFKLLPEKGFLPDFSAIPSDIARRARMIFLNYPNNPTAAVADVSFFEEAVAFAKSYDIIVVHDNAYSEVAYDGYRPASFLQAEGAMDVGVEFNSLSKPFNMTGWRIGFAYGNKDIIAGLSIIKTNVDSGVFQAVQYAGIKALQENKGTDELNAVYTRRRDMVVETFNDMGWKLDKPKATFYIWAPVPDGYASSVEFAAAMLEKASVVITPGIGYGETGNGYFRISITLGDQRLKEAMDRIKKNL